MEETLARWSDFLFFFSNFFLYFFTKFNEILSNIFFSLATALHILQLPIFLFFSADVVYAFDYFSRLRPLRAEFVFSLAKTK